MGKVADLYQPLVDRLTQKTLAAYLNQTDATGVKVLDPESPENIPRGMMWCWVGDERNVVFRYTPTRERGVRGSSCGPQGIRPGRRGERLRRVCNGRVASAVEV